MSERDPRIDPMPGDKLRVNGKTIEVDEADPRKPTTVYFMIGRQSWHCGLFYWQASMGRAEVVKP